MADAIIITQIVSDEKLNRRSKIPFPKFHRFEDWTERKEQIERGLESLGELASTYAPNLAEWRLNLQIILEALPDNINGHIEVKCKRELMKIHDRLPLRARGNAWFSILEAIELMMEELPVSRKISRNTIKEILAILKSRRVKTLEDQIWASMMISKVGVEPYTNSVKAKAK